MKAHVIVCPNLIAFVSLAPAASTRLQELDHGPTISNACLGYRGPRTRRGVHRWGLEELYNGGVYNSNGAHLTCEYGRRLLAVLLMYDSKTFQIGTILMN